MAGLFIERHKMSTTKAVPDKPVKNVGRGTIRQPTKPDRKGNGAA